MDKRVASWLVVFTATVITCSLIAVISSPKNVEEPLELNDIAKQLILVNYQNNHTNIINNLPDIVNLDAKSLLLLQTSEKYKARSPYDEIKDIEFVLYSQETFKDDNTYWVVSKYKEQLLFNAAMTTITTFKVQKGQVIEIETHDYTDSVHINLD